MVKILLGVVIVLGLGCTKEVPFKEAPKDEQLTSKNLIDTRSEYLYVVSNGESSRTSPASRPFWMGQEKLVQLQFTEDSLQVIELDRSNVFRLNPTNNKLVLEIPVTHIDYHCAKDQFGECTNQEEENRNLTWKDRGYFKPKIRDMKVTEISILPVELENYLGAGCYQETGASLLDYDLSPEAINIRVEKTFRANLECLDDNAESLSDAVFSSVYHYSIVRLDQLVSRGYAPIEYPQYDENEMGFFTTELKELDPDNRDVVLGKKVFMNRWSPDRKVITYHLNKNFYRPDNKKLLQATERSVESVNRSLEKANAGLKIELKNGSHLPEGDLRHNFVILVDDPLAQGIIGYGPSVANPLTGEIVNGKVVMYAGTIKKFIKRTYDEFAEQEKIEASTAAVALSLDPNLVPKVGKRSFVNLNLDIPKDQISRIPERSKQNLPINVAKVSQETKTYHRHADASSKLKDRIEALSAHCAYPAELMNFEQAVRDALKEITGGKFPPWDELSEGQKRLIVDTVLPYVWIPTLVHEFGHNLGLRHNFAGSEDKHNYYSEKELEEMGAAGPIPYSSVMDYSYSTLNELPTMGKYDIAALRFAYAREVEVVGKGFVRVDSTLKELDRQLEKESVARRPYQFCTDEHVSANPGCNRFDEGTTLTEMAAHFVKSYERDYKNRNFRNGLRNFSIINDIDAARRLNQTFKSLRLFFELYERLESEFNIPPELWDQHEFLKDVRGAADIAITHFVNVLKVPDAMCAAVSLENPQVISAIVPLSIVDPDAISCLDPMVQNTLIQFGLIPVGQGGKSFQSKKDRSNDNPYVDQIDQRGIWIDKVLAIKYLFGRTLDNSIFDRHRKNSTHFARYSPLALQSTLDLLMDDVESTVPFELVTGQVFPIRLRHSPMMTHQIQEHLDSRIKRSFVLPDDNYNFDQLLVDMITRESSSNIETLNAQLVGEIFEVYKNPNASGHRIEEFESVSVGSRKYFALKENIIALIAIRSIHALRDLAQIPQDRLAQILADLAAGKGAPEGASEVEKRVYALGAEMIDAYLNGQLQTENHFVRLLSILRPMN